MMAGEARPWAAWPIPKTFRSILLVVAIVLVVVLPWVRVWRMSSQQVTAIDEGYPIAEVIEDVRDELLSAQRKWNEDGSMPLFKLEYFDLELAFVVRRSESANAQANFELIAVGGGSKVDQERVQRIKLHLKALESEDVSVIATSGTGPGRQSNAVPVVVTRREGE